MRHEYSDLIGDDLTYENYYVRTSKKSRTIESAYYYLLGLKDYPIDLKLNITEDYLVHIRPPFESTTA